MREWLARFRDRWSVPWLDHLQQDVRYAIRGLRRSPGFTATVVLTLALGIGANTMMFGIVDRLMFRPYPHLRDPSAVHRVYWRSWHRETQRTRWDTEYPRYLDLQRWTTSFSQYAAFTNRVVAVGTGEASRERMVSAVSATFFDFFDARPAVGRFFARAEDVPGRGDDVVVLGYDFWQVEYGGRDVLGQMLQVGNSRATIIGVAPKGFVGVSDVVAPAVFLPITTFARVQPDRRTATTYFNRYSWRWLEIIVRRKPGVSVAQATADASQSAVKSWNAERVFDSDLAPADIAKPVAIASAMKLGAGPNPSLEARTALWVAGVAAIVLLIACANVANLLLARALKRQRETALRLALGVSRVRLAMQSLWETIALSVAGGAAGVLIAHWAGPIVQRLLVAGSDAGAASLDLATDWRTLLLAIGLAGLVAVITGLAPALLSGRGDLTRSLRGGARGGMSQHSGARTALLVIQGALSAALLIGAGLFVKSLRHVGDMHMGYDTESVLVATGRLRDTRLDDSASVALRRTLVETAQALPDVEYASWTMTLPLAITNSTDLFVAGIDSVKRLGSFTYQAATPDYFRAMGTRIVRGRGFSADDRAGTPRVVVVSESMAKVLWPAQDAIGRCIRVFADTMPCATVVGVAEDIVQDDLVASQRFHYYMVLDQFSPGAGSTLVMRVRGNPASHREAVREALQRVMPGSSYITVRPLLELVDGARRSWKLGATMFAAFGLVALIVSAVGLYGVVAYDVTQRMHEMGVRIALGAQAPDILRLVVGRGVAFAAAGVTIGLATAFVAARWLQPLLFQASARDPAIYAAVAAVIGVVAVLASAGPAIRATLADPNTALRSD